MAVGEVPGGPAPPVVVSLPAWVDGREHVGRADRIICLSTLYFSGLNYLSLDRGVSSLNPRAVLRRDFAPGVERPGGGGPLLVRVGGGPGLASAASAVAADVRPPVACAIIS